MKDRKPPHSLEEQVDRFYDAASKGDKVSLGQRFKREPESPRVKAVCRMKM